MSPAFRFLLSWLALSLAGRDYAVTVLDEEGVAVPGVALAAIFARVNDPRYASMRTSEGATDGHGVFRFRAAEDMCLVRVRASKAGWFEADVTEAHGLGKVPSDPSLTLTLPRRVEGIPLCYKEVLLSERDGTLPVRTWVGFDLERGEAIRPWGKGEIADISFWNDGEKVGWTRPAETIGRLREDQDHARMSDAEFDRLYGSFRGVTRLRCEGPGAGIMRSPAFWPYCLLKMPAVAPAEGYATLLELPYSTLPLPDGQGESVGYFLRVRVRLGADGQVLSARYAKIQRAIRHDRGVVAFRYYYNPAPDDRRLAHDMRTNLLRPGPGIPGHDLERYRSQEP